MFAHPIDRPAEEAFLAAKLPELLTALDYAGNHLKSLDIGNPFKGFNCGEIDALADVFRVVGHADVAAQIIAYHSEGDSAEDRHDDIRYSDVEEQVERDWPDQLAQARAYVVDSL